MTSSSGMVSMPSESMSVLPTVIGLTFSLSFHYPISFRINSTSWCLKKSRVSASLHSKPHFFKSSITSAFHKRCAFPSVNRSKFSLLLVSEALIYRCCFTRCSFSLWRERPINTWHNYAGILLKTNRFCLQPLLPHVVAVFVLRIRPQAPLNFRYSCAIPTLASTPSNILQPDTSSSCGNKIPPNLSRGRLLLALLVEPPLRSFYLLFAARSSSPVAMYSPKWLLAR